MYSDVEIDFMNIIIKIYQQNYQVQEQNVCMFQ